ncbi:MAG: single-stranded-DNA-specific exonuclease RecJ [candidate division WOR-3 bacterium]
MINKYQWIINNLEKDWEKIEEEINLPLPIIKILWQRGYQKKEEIENFLNPKAKDLFLPSLLPDIEKGVERIKEAVKKKERILIFGDYDVDGITATALLFSTLKKIGASVNFYIPHREKEGYGLSDTVILYAKSHGYKVLITVDCGSNDLSLLKFAKRLKLDVIICDHHEVQQEADQAFAFINPKRKDSKYPFRELAGVGVAFKLSWALLQTFDFNKEDLIENLDLVCLGTICDVVPLIGENRILARLGINYLNKRKRLGLNYLIREVGLKNKEITSYDISFIIGPRLNASGRITHAEKAVRLLITDNEEEAKNLAEQLEKDNKKRQLIEEKILKEAKEIIKKEEKDKNPIILLGKEDWHEGVIGICASKIVEEFYKPTILFSLKENYAKGSGRSTPHFPLFEVVKANSQYLLKFGGHKYACGLLLKKKELKNFEESIINYIEKNIDKEIYQRKLYIDCELNLNEINYELLNYLKKLEPFGIENPAPVFLTRNLEVVGFPRVVGDRHLKFKVRQKKEEKEAWEVLAFNEAKAILKLAVGKQDYLNLVYTFDEDSFFGKKKIVLYVKDMFINVAEDKS